MRIYEFMARRSWPRSYTGKILLVSFLGVHVPMFGAVGYALLADPTPIIQQLDVLGAMLVATLIGTAATMFVMNALLAPMKAATEAANGYLRERRMPRLPTQYSDSAGVLMSSVQEAITRLDGSLAALELQHQTLEKDHASKFRILSGLQHDFRTPLTHILGLSEIMKSEAIGPIGSESYRKYASKIGASGRDLLKTLNSVLDLSDAQISNQLREDSETLDLGVVAREAVALEHLLAEKRGVTVQLDSAETVSAHTVRDAARGLLNSLLQAGIEGTSAGKSVTLRLAEGSANATMEMHSQGGRLLREDVPAELQHHFAGLESGTGSLAEGPETSTPMTLRISLIDTLARAIGATTTMRQDAEGWSMAVALPRPASRLAIAAE